ncbi:MAG: hypothetical protein K2N87_08710 [Eubacterium sp.]|nr:hypothetical protein [Eubacterium sp.]
MDKLKIAGTALFCVLLGAGWLSFYILPQKEYSDLENRFLQTKPELDLEDFFHGSYQESYESYLNDQMPGRDGWVRLAAQMELLLGKKDINGVYIGRDGYLLEKYDASEYDSAKVKENIGFLSQFLNDAVQRYGKERVSCIILPDKAGAMPDKLPAFASDSTVQERNALADLKKSLDEPGILLDMQPALLKHQDEYIYYRTDHHWTTLGAYYAYCEWAGQTGHKALGLDSFDRETAFDDFYGTTYNKAHIRVPMDQVELFHSLWEEGVTVDNGEAISDSFYFIKSAKEGFNRYNVFFSKNTAEIQISTKADTGRRLLVVKDSFANCFVPFLAGDFEEIIMVDCRYGTEHVNDILKRHDEITDLLVMYNIRKFMQDKNLHKLDQAEGMEIFDAESFFDE